jgi:hypothetical protein
MTTKITFEAGLKTAESVASELRGHLNAGEVLANRLFIAREVRDRGLHDRWMEAVKAFDQKS